MRKRFAQGGWVAQAATIAAYAACYMALRAVSVSHWNLPAGLRVLCLLFVPYRYWPALVVGEALPLCFEAWDYHERFGWWWAVIGIVPPIALNAPVFAWCRRRMKLFDAGQPNMVALLGAILLGAALTALADTAALATVRLPGGEPGPAITARIVLGYLLGNDLGALTLVPAALALRSWLAGHKGRPSWQAAARSVFARDLALGVLPLLLWLMWLTTPGNDEVMQLCRMAMFLPVAWMTLRYGWQGAAVAGMLASAAVQLTMTVVRDPAVIQAQALIAFAISTLLMLGSRLSPARTDVADAGDMLRGFQLAQQGLYQEELRLRQTAEALDRIGQSMRDSQKRLLDRLRPVLPANMEHVYSRQAAITQHEMHRLSDALYPKTWRERGAPATFQDGPLAQAAALAGACYRCDIAGCGLDQLAPDVHMMLYRLACEAMVYVLAREPVRRIHLQIRGGRTRGRRWVVLRMTCHRAAPAYRHASAPEWKQVVSLLGASGQGIRTIQDRAHIYGGVVHQRDSDDQLSVSLLLHDALRVGSATVANVAFERPVSA
ncbi:MASE1 domain-containing protein [Dyella soli]|uniref:MASE1 domain-containing protein n=1 Tax=Dyella soli TaxID=522319 RepID=UPI0013F3C0D1|nr:MASE1 domain-containing protein [Dyella soli]